MSEPLDQQIDIFLSIFKGDLSAAQHALSRRVNTIHTTLQPSDTPVHHASEVIISARDVSKRYMLGRQPVEALHGVSLDIYKGEFVAITGASGSGKSTLLQLLGCLEKPTSGKLIVAGKDITRLGDATLSNLRKRTIGFVFQSFYLQPFLRVNDNIGVPAMFTGLGKKVVDEKVTRLLNQVDLTDRARHFPKQLSGGQIQRAAIARALINNPQIILADEPTGNLDSKNSQSVIDLFKSIRSESGTTIVIVTHDATIAQQTDRVIELKDGAVI